MPSSQVSLNVGRYPALQTMEGQPRERLSRDLRSPTRSVKDRQKVACPSSLSWASLLDSVVVDQGMSSTIAACL